jgi:hypothetical protein
MSASGASTIVLGVKHEMVDDQLLLAIEEVTERDRLIARALEEILLVDLDHGELTALSGKDIALVRILLFFLEKNLTGGKPLFTTANLLIINA